MRVAFAGTPALAVPVLDALVAAGHDVVLVVSAPDKRRGRGGALSPSPVKAAALAAGLAVSDDPTDLASCGAEVGVVVAYGRILRPEVVAALPLVNLHVSLLPRWRGAAPVERAVLAGDPVTGVCVMAVTDGLDEGGVYARAETPVGDDETVHELRARLVEAGTSLLIDLLDAGVPLPPPEPQVGETTYAAKLEAGEFELDWTGTAIDAHRRVRVGGAWTLFRGRRLKVHAAARTAEPTPGPGRIEVRDGRVLVGAADTALELLDVQPEGRPRMAATAWANGAQPTDDEEFGR